MTRQMCLVGVLLVGFLSLAQQTASAAPAKRSLYYWVVEVQFEDFEYGDTYWGERFRSYDEAEARDYYITLLIAKYLGLLTEAVGQPHPRYIPIDVRWERRTDYPTQLYLPYGSYYYSLGF